MDRDKGHFLFSAPDLVSEAEREQYPTLEDHIRDAVVPEMQRKLRQGFDRGSMVNEINGRGTSMSAYLYNDEATNIITGL